MNIHAVPNYPIDHLGLQNSSPRISQLGNHKSCNHFGFADWRHCFVFLLDKKMPVMLTQNKFFRRIHINLAHNYLAMTPIIFLHLQTLFILIAMGLQKP